VVVRNCGKRPSAEQQSDQQHQSDDASFLHFFSFASKLAESITTWCFTGKYLQADGAGPAGEALGWEREEGTPWRNRSGGSR
jgi:hypothetical protein